MPLTVPILEGVLTGQNALAGEEFYPYKVDMAPITADTIYGNRAILRGMWVSAATVFAVELLDGASNKLTIPAGTPSGPYFFGDITFVTNLNLTCNASETAVITFFVKPMK